MKPRNPFQRQVVDYMPSLRPLTLAQKQWGYENSLYKFAFRRPNGKTFCMECGHEYETREGLKQSVCPHCHKQLKVEETKRWKLRREGYFCIVTTRKELQVIRYFKVYSTARVRQSATYQHYEVMQLWMDESGKTAITALPRAMFAGYTDGWNLAGKIELRQHCNAIEYIDGCPTYPSISTIPAIRRNGFKGYLHHIAPAALFEALLTDPKIETLFKAGRYALARYFTYTGRTKAEKYWQSVKIALRNKYVVEDASVWCDYLDALNYMGKDIHNPKFVCPADLNAEHDRWMEKKSKKMEAEREKRRLEEAREDEETFRRLKSKFFGIQFTDGLISVHVLDSIESYYLEGSLLHHCVASNRYYLKEDSLILSATIEGKRIETIEISLKDLKILQCYGACNQFTEHHKRILDLVNKNAYLIGQRIAA